MPARKGGGVLINRLTTRPKWTSPGRVIREPDGPAARGPAPSRPLGHPSAHVLGGHESRQGSGKV